MEGTIFTPAVLICMGIAIGFMLGIFTGALMCIRKVSEAEWEQAAMHDKYIKLKEEYQAYVDGSEDAPKDIDNEWLDYLKDPKEGG